MSEGSQLLLCYNHGCGKEYSEKENFDDVCIYHPGDPVFHDALKGWSCCARRVTDFTEFLNITGCCKSKHSNTKPAKSEVKQQPSVDNSVAPKKTTHRKPKEKISKARPSDELPYKTLKFTVSNSLKSLLSKQKHSGSSNEENIEPEVIKKGTICQNNSCDCAYVNSESDDQPCKYHPGCPVFHEGYKFWSCCLRKTCDFDEFLKQEGCSTGSHVWLMTDEQKKKAVSCRFDHYQMGGFIVVSIYAKLCDPNRSCVEANYTCLKASLIFEGASRFDLDIKLYGVIEPEMSSVTYLANKIEIKLRMKEHCNWPSLQRKSEENMK